MSKFVLVHGSYCGGWVWNKLVPILRAEGHEVYAPTLTGLSDRSHLLHCGVNLTTHITDIVNLITYENLTDVILVGNSYGGMVITGVAAKIPKRLKLLVYLDAYVPEGGQSEVDLWPPERRAWAEKSQAEGIGLDQPPPLAIFGVNEPELVGWMEDRMSPQPISTYTEPVPHGDSNSGALPRVFILCTEWPPTTPNIFNPFAKKAREQGWDVHEIATGHIAMVTAPLELSKLLLAVCKR